MSPLLMHGQGIDLAIEVIPRMLERFPNVYFIVSRQTQRADGRSNHPFSSRWSVHLHIKQKSLLLLLLLIHKHSFLHFYLLIELKVGGDGPKRLPLEEMIERHQAHDRVELLGVSV